MSVAKRVLFFTAGYLLLGALWILLSDWAAFQLAATPAEEWYLQTLKGLVYVLGTGLILAFWLWRYLQRERDHQSQFEEERRKQETLLANLPGMAYQCLNDEHWTMLYLSRGCKELTGYEPDELLESGVRGFQDLILEEDRERIRRSVQSAVQEGTRFEVEYRIQRSDGQVRWVWEQGSSIDRLSNPEVLEGLILDVHDEKLAKEGLKESEHRFSMAIREAPLPLLIHAEDGEIVSVSRTWTELSGHRREDIPTVAEWTERAYGERKEVVRAGLRKLYDLEAFTRKEEGEFRIRCADGSERIWDFSSVSLGQLPDGRRIVMSMAADVTERLAMERELSERVEVLEKIFEHVPVMLCFVDESGTIQLANREFEETFGWSTEELRDTPRILQDIYPDSETYEQVLQFIGRGEGVFSEFLSRARDGRTITTSWANVKLTDGTTIGIGLDVTKSRQDEERRRQLESQMHQAQKMESLARFAGGVAHDFKNLLTVVMAEAQLAQLDMETDDPCRAPLDRIADAAVKSAQLADRLLVFGRRQEVEAVAVDVAEHLAKTAKLLEPVMGENIQIHADIQPDSGTVKIDPVQLEQVITNLCINAREAMPRGGRLTLGVRRVRLSREQADQFPSLQPGEHVEIEVSDNGTGIPVDIQDRVFEPFFTTKGEGRGTGLGLATVHSIIEASGGHVRLESAPGSGSCFRILFPRFGESAEAQTEIAAAAEGGEETVLVVDDEPSVRIVVSRMLEARGYRVLVADNPGIALQLAAEHPEKIDLLLADVVMPVMDGPDLAGILLKRRPEMRVLYMTGYHERALEPSEGNVIRKPFKADELAHQVREALDS